MGTVIDDPFTSLAQQLAESPDLIKALLTDHRNDDTGHCRTCTAGGTGLRTVEMPCAVRKLAEVAAILADAERESGR